MRIFFLPEFCNQRYILHNNLFFETYFSSRLVLYNADELGGKRKKNYLYLLLGNNLFVSPRSVFVLSVLIIHHIISPPVRLFFFPVIVLNMKIDMNKIVFFPLGKLARNFSGQFTSRKGGVFSFLCNELLKYI